MTASRSPGRSPTTALLLGLIITLATVVAYSWYISGQISGLRRLQTELTDRNRRDSLQLLRIQNDLNQLGLAMRDMLDGGEPYPLTAWSSQFDRIRTDLTRHWNARAKSRSPGRRRSSGSTRQPARAVLGCRQSHLRACENRARRRSPRAMRFSLQERQAALEYGGGAAARAEQCQRGADRAAGAGHLRPVQRQVYWFLAATLAAIVATSLYLIHSNRRLFAQLAALSDERRELAQRFIATRESTLRRSRASCTTSSARF